MRALRLAPVLLATLVACATTEVEPELVESSRFVAADGSYSLELPLGWKRAEQALTLEGWEHQSITFNAGPVLAGEEGGVDPSAPELLTAMRDQLLAQPGIDLIECRAATLDGLPGFRMQYRETTGETPDAAPHVEVVVYGAVEGPMLYAFSLESRDPATFARDQAVFESLVASFRHADPPPSTR
jgi:hypothetical protein